MYVDVGYQHLVHLSFSSKVPHAVSICDLGSFPGLEICVAALLYGSG